MQRRFARWVLVALGVLGVAQISMAQMDKADIFVGYSHLGDNAFHSGAGSLNGWEGAMNVKVRRFVGIEGDLSKYGMGSASTRPHTTLLMAGPRVTVGTMGVHVFVHGLIGGEHTSDSTGLSATSMAVGYGGGGDLRFLPYLSLRVSADYLTSPTSSPAGASHARFSTGIVVRF